MKPYRIPLDEVELAAKSAGFFRIAYKEDQGLVSYSQGNIRINIYLTKMTVATCFRKLEIQECLTKELYII